jgi:hypothetical protein
VNKRSRQWKNSGDVPYFAYGFGRRQDVVVVATTWDHLILKRLAGQLGRTGGWKKGFLKDFIFGRTRKDEV